MGNGAAERRVAELVAAGTKWSDAQAREVLAAWEASGESVSAFARRLGIVAQRLWWWRSRLGMDATPSFVPIEVRGAWPAIVVTMDGGTRIEVASVDAASAEWVATVAVALRGGR